MSNTPNLGLPVYGSSDTPDWLDTNNGFEKLDNIVGGAAGVQLDFANPLHLFTSSNNTYTAVKTCWLFGTFMATNDNYGIVSIDGTRVAGIYDSNAGYPSAIVPPTRVEAGSVISVTNIGPDMYPGRQCLGVYDGKIVSDSFVWNEAIVEYDYGNPLHTFTTNNLTFTATKRCWLVGALSNGRIVTINGTYISEGMNSATTELNIPLSKGDVVVSSQENLYLHVFDGEIKGSAPGNGGTGGVLELLDFNNAIELTNTNITTPKAGAVMGSMYASGNNQLYINDVLYYQNASSEVYDLTLCSVPKGTKLQLGKNNESSYKVRFVPYKYESIAPEITVYNEAEVELDYANPLHTFSSENLTYTATEDCYLCGSIGQDNATLTINGTNVAKGWYGSGYVSNPFISPIKISIGDVVSVSAASPILNIYRGTKVGSVGNLTGAWIPDYSNLIASPAVSDNSYTCIEDCVVEISGQPNMTGLSCFEVNNHMVASCYYSTLVTNMNKTLNCQKGDVISWTNIFPDTFVCSVFGLL